MYIFYYRVLLIFSSLLFFIGITLLSESEPQSSHEQDMSLPSGINREFTVDSLPSNEEEEVTVGEESLEDLQNKMKAL